MNRGAVGLFLLLLAGGAWALYQGIAEGLPALLAALAVLAWQASRWLVFRRARPRLNLASEGMVLANREGAWVVPWELLHQVATFGSGGGSHSIGLAISGLALPDPGSWVRWGGLLAPAVPPFDLVIDGTATLEGASALAQRLATPVTDPAARSALPAVSSFAPGAGVAVGDVPGGRVPPASLLQASGPFPVTLWLLGGLALVFLVVSWSAGTTDAPVPVLTRFGAFSAQLVEAGQWWRLFTPVLLHGSVPHIVLNGIALLVLGRILEPLLGRLELLAVFVLAGVGGSLASLLLPGDSVSVGASGAIMGLVGILTVLGWRNRHNPNLPAGRQLGVVGLAFLAPNLVLSFEPNVNWLAHLGGFLTGALLAAVLPLAWRLNRELRPLWLTALWWAAVLFGALATAAGAVQALVAAAPS
ncbi:MAG: rhomboid family intramembrane serine protease [Candidatus Dormibacteria bacterium]